MDFLDIIEKKLKEQPKKKIILPESNDERILKAAALSIESDLVDIILLGNKEKISEKANKSGVDLSRAEFFDIAMVQD